VLRSENKKGEKKMAIRRIATVLMAAMAAVATAQITNEEREAFLKSAAIVRTKNLSMGVTLSRKASMSNGTIEHDAHIQTVNEYKAKFEGTTGTEMNFRDSYKYNVAAYRIAKLLNLNMVPPSVERKVEGSTAAVTWWVDDVAMTEFDRRKRKQEAPDANDWNKQMSVVHVFDELIYNVDRNMGNLVITRDWSIWMIDHTRAFRWHKACPKLKNLKQIDRNLLVSLKKLTREQLQQEVGAYLMKPEIEGLLARRDVIVKHFEDKLAENGEAKVLYEMARR
jgi:hypothetical protein